MIRIACLFFAFILLHFTGYGAPAGLGGGNPSSDEIVQKEVTALRIEESIQIDGHLDEAAWLKVDAASEFVQYQPNPGLDVE